MSFEATNFDQTTTCAIDAGDEVVLLRGSFANSTTYGFQASHDDAISLSVPGSVVGGLRGLQIGSSAQ